VVNEWKTEVAKELDFLHEKQNMEDVGRNLSQVRTMLLLLLLLLLLACTDVGHHLLLPSRSCLALRRAGCRCCTPRSTGDDCSADAAERLLAC